MTTPVYTSSIITVRGVLTPKYLRSRMAPYRIPLETADQLVHYIHNGVPPGSFVRAVLENDLIQAVRKGDMENKVTLSRIVEFLYCTCPTGAWMSEAQVEAWLGAHRLYREMHVKISNNRLKLGRGMKEIPLNEIDRKSQASGEKDDE